MKQIVNDGMEKLGAEQALLNFIFVFFISHLGKSHNLTTVEFEIKKDL